MPLGASMSDRLFRQHRQRGVIVDGLDTGNLVQRTTVTVVGVFAEADIGDHKQLGYGSFDRPYRLLDDALVRHRIAAEPVLDFGNAKQQDATQAELLALGRSLNQPIDRNLVLSRHRRDFLLDSLAAANKHRLNQVGRVQAVAS